MKISEIKKNNIFPFEIKDRILRLIFSFFLHKAPKLDSHLALKIDINEEEVWNNYIKDWDKETYRFYSSELEKKKPLDGCNLIDDSMIKRKDRGFICIKNKGENEYRCLTRHLRNSIAHGHVYMKKQSNRIFLLFEDYAEQRMKKPPKKTAIILVSKNDLIKLKHEIKKEKNKNNKMNI